MPLNGDAGLTPDPDQARFAANLSRLRLARKLSREALGHQIGSSGKALEHWEAGTGNPNIRYIVRIAGFFGITTDELLGVHQDPDEERTRLGLMLKLHAVVDIFEARLKKLEDDLAHDRARREHLEEQLAHDLAAQPKPKPKH